MKKLLIFLHAFVGIGALFGGGGAILNPNSPMGISVDALKNSPFSNFLIPGIILLVLIGFANIFAAVILYFNYEYSLYISHLMGLVLIGWITVQCIMMMTVNILHIIYFMIGGIEMLISLRLIISKRSIK